MSIPGGSQIVAKPIEPSVFGYNAGTLGAWVRYTMSGEPAFLTNGHVLPKVAVDVYHPTAQGSVIGAVLDTGFDNRIDAAIGKCSEQKAYEYATKAIGEQGVVYRGFEDPQQDECVYMFGAKSKYGIADVNLNVAYTKYGTRCFEIKMWDDYPFWGQHGDSGTVLVNSSENIVGIHWGSNGQTKYAHYISDVQRLLRIAPL